MENNTPPKHFSFCPIVFGCASDRLTKEEAVFFEQVQPWGFILFKRNCLSPQQISTLVKDLRSCARHEAIVFIDQEGGRVRRLPSPPFFEAPPAHAYGKIFHRNRDLGREMCYLGSRITAEELRAVGIDANCAPVLDLGLNNEDTIIGDRAFCATPQHVSQLGLCALQGLEDAGVLGVGKHFPGHGVTSDDSHKTLPIVRASREELESSLMPFRNLAWAFSCFMSAHVLYTAYDPHLPATLSSYVMSQLRCQIGFENGLMLSDDLSMHALDPYGALDIRAKRAQNAGCDILLHCNGNLEEMQLLSRTILPATHVTQQRLKHTEKLRHQIKEQHQENTTRMKTLGQTVENIQSRYEDLQALSERLTI